MKHYLMMNILFISQISAMGIDWVNEVDDYSQEKKEILYNPQLTEEFLLENWKSRLTSIYNWFERIETWEKSSIAYFQKKDEIERTNKSELELSLIQQKKSIVQAALNRQKTSEN